MKSTFINIYTAIIVHNVSVNIHTKKCIKSTTVIFIIRAEGQLVIKYYLYLTLGIQYPRLSDLNKTTKYHQMVIELGLDSRFPNSKVSTYFQ